MKQDLTIPHGALDGIEAFLRVAERRSFSAAAADLGVSPSAISQTVKALEARVGAPLFMRTTRSVGLTQAGEMFLERAAPAFAGLADAYEAARNLGNRPAGRLRINLMRGAVQPMFEPIIAGFVDAYPEIELEIYADDALADLSAGGFDAGVRMGESLDADVIAIRLTGPFRFVAFGDIQTGLPTVDDVFAEIATVTPPPRFVVFMGDLTERAEEDEYELADDQLTTLSIPFYATLGNHELWADPARYRARYGRASYQFTYRDVAFTFVDSGDAGLAPAVEDELDGWLAAASRPRPAGPARSIR